jgi:pectate lyase
MLRRAFSLGLGFSALVAIGCGESATNDVSGAAGQTSGGSSANGGSAGATTAAGTNSVAGNPSGGSGSAGEATGGSSNAGASSGGAGSEAGGTDAGGSGAAGSAGSVGSAGSDAGGPDSDETAAPPLAFPGAQGFGNKATGGRAGSVYHVTNLNDSGAGSFRDAVSKNDRIVVFDVGGYIKLATAVSVKSNITIAGQSAPGGGIGFRSGEISFANSTNVICRFIRVRPGSETHDDTDDALSLYRAKNVMIDHSSFELAPWNNIDGVSDDWQAHPATDISIQDSIIADPTGQQFGAHTESVASQWAWYRNVFANSHNRNPLAKVNTVFVNNVLYNYSAAYTTHTSTSFKHDIVQNYFIFGPASTGTDNTWFQVDKNQSIHYAGNIKDTDRDGALGGAETTPYWYQGAGTVLDKPWSTETLATPPLDVKSAVRVATSLAGPLPHDPLDELILSQVRTLGKGTTGTGVGTTGPGGALYTSQAQTGLDNSGYGTIASGTKPADADNDGMSDAWEAATGSDPKLDDAMSKLRSGFTRVERYLNFLAAPHATSAGGAAVSVDLASYGAGFAAVSPTYAVSGAEHGSVVLDGHTAKFTPAAGFHGVGAFTFAISGSDGSKYTARVLVLAAP